MLKLERGSLKKCKRLDFLNNILLQVPNIVNLNVTHFNKDTKYLYQNNKSVLDFKNKLFGAEITDVFWISKIILSSEREDSIRHSFEDQDVHFSYPTDLDEFNYLISNFTQEKSSYSDEDEFLGENLKVNKLIVMEMFQVWQIINLKIFQTF